MDPELVRLIASMEAQLLLGVVLAAVLHELGHAIAVVAVGGTLRQIVIGSGRPLLPIRIGSWWLVLRLFPLTGLVWRLVDPAERRWQAATITAAGPAANALVLAGLAALGGTGARFDAFLPYALPQALFLVLTLLPISRNLNGLALPSDGMKLWRMARRGYDDPMKPVRELLLRPYLPAGEPLPPPSAESAEISFQAVRRDRLVEGWASRDAISVLRDVLERGRTPPAETAAVLDLLVGIELIFGPDGVTPDELDAWSLRLVEIADGPGTRIKRAGVLARQGWPDAALRMLEPLSLAELPAEEKLGLQWVRAEALARLGDRDGAQAALDAARALLTPVQTKILRWAFDRVTSRVIEIAPPANP